MASFDQFFKTATEHAPFAFQTRFAEDGELAKLVSIPTGCGKTAMAILGWLWRRRFAAEAIRAATPRRLVYCLPMRVLVEQTEEAAHTWITNLEKAGKLPKQAVRIHVLMGGEVEADWVLFPEADAILIGTQDMLLSRALNRGYAASRSRWPIEFGLLNNDCLWVFDEVQLMGNGLATSAQLDAFRNILQTCGTCRSVWMSATIQREWLRTIDRPVTENDRILELSDEDLRNPEIRERVYADKALIQADVSVQEASSDKNVKEGDILKQLADRVITEHGQAGKSLTLVMVNTVERAQRLYKEIGKKEDIDKILLHSRFRPPDRENAITKLGSELPNKGRIVVSTQVVEAGVDISAKTLFTELAPWSSLVQRFGRCNRRGEYNESKDARIFWMELATESAPYEPEDLEAAKQQLMAIAGKSAAPLLLPKVAIEFRHRHVLRRKDLVELFDTTPDLAGNDIDVSRYVREIEEHDVQVFWRDWGEGEPGKDIAPSREELCPVPIGEFKEFAGKLAKGKIRFYRWDFLDGSWRPAEPNRFCPGQIYLLDTKAGGYSTDIGWDPKLKEPVAPVEGPTPAPNDAMGEDSLSKGRVFQTIQQHADQVCGELESMLRMLDGNIAELGALRLAARWHDRGKAHDVFQKAADVAEELRGQCAKAPKINKYGRKHFRHELASALAVLQAPSELIPDEVRDLVAYLVGAHHGKVRLSIRSMPGEPTPDHDPMRRFARGIWDGDPFPRTDLGGGVTAPEVQVSLEPMELGLSQDGQPSWIERMIRLRDSIGPFRLAYLEALLRMADWRASGSEISEEEHD